MRKCTKCQTDKEEEQFFWKNKTSGKRHSQCKDCYYARRKNINYYAAHRDEYVKRSMERKKMLFEENSKNLLVFLSDKGCMVCNESNPIMLEFDHRDRSQKKKGISEMMRSHTWSQILQEIDKCDILCANHHKVRTAHQFGWYKIGGVVRET